jgi:mannose-1-phosphate guanylyltransferase/mannose-1-phosphate guanylyltransferase/mannose-6-phosphate isomerase
MFAFSAQFMTEQFRALAPDVVKPFEKLKAPKAAAFKSVKGVKVLGAWTGLDNAYRTVKGISFDYAIAEKCPNTVMVKTNFDWIDIGNWEEYIKLGGKNNSQVFEEAAEGCYVDSDIPVALAGVQDLIVVIRCGKDGSPASALIAKKGQTQKVKDIVEQIKKAGKTEIL